MPVDSVTEIWVSRTGCRVGAPAGVSEEVPVGVTVMRHTQVAGGEGMGTSERGGGGVCRKGTAGY